MSEKIPYTIERSRRRTLAIQVRGAQVIVRAPLQCPKAQIDRLLLEKQDWIRAHLAQQTAQQQKRNAFTLGYGDMVLLRGREYPLRAGEQARARFDGNACYLPAGLAEDGIREMLIALYKKQARAHLTQRTAFFAQQMQLACPPVAITGATTRWGSCSRARINYTWRLILAPDDAIDAVVVHELAHRLHPNHGPAFWQTVYAVMPDYAQRHGALKALQQKLLAENWG